MISFQYIEGDAGHEEEPTCDAVPNCDRKAVFCFGLDASCYHTCMAHVRYQLENINIWEQRRNA